MQPFVPTSVAQYRAYGDSITYGFTLSDPATQSYPNLVAKYEHVTVANNALSANQACDVPTAQIFPNQDSPTLATHPTYTLLIGTNDVTFKGVGPYEAVFKLCHQATISWFALPAEYKVLASGMVGVTTTGAGAIDTTNNWNSWTTGGLGSTVSFAITTSHDGPIYAWPRIDDDNPATYSYSVDGVVLGTGSVQTTPRIATSALHTTNSLSFLRLPSIPAGKHVVTFTQTSAGANGVSVVGIGTPTGPPANSLPSVLVGTIPFHVQNPGDPCNFPKGTCQVYIEDIEADVNLFSADGLNVRLFDTRKYMFGTPAEMNDMLHPNRLGQMELSRSVEASW
ncbi:hypothetical protein [Tunturiibacter gelidiferens]|uniref:hypothetical protein n=1 Tax=Tunturiibacter gelidiferens TaxID=3069689 RepID=UPI003D9BD787